MMRIEMKRLMKCLCSVALVGFFLAGVLQAQTVTGSVTGTVTDASGALVPNATVVAEAVDTGVKTKASTNASGTYTIRFLPIGKYKVTVNAGGFSPLSFTVFSLEIDQTIKLDSKVNCWQHA